MSPGERLAACLAKLPSEGRAKGIVAISGGADSVALAHLVRQHPETTIALAHLNHQLRGAESDADEEFVRELAARWSLPVATARIDVAERARGRNLEQTARTLRYDWLTQIALEHRAGWIATAHTADDQAETVLHHFLRGTGLSGLSGIAERLPLADGMTLVRPLLDVRRQELLAMLKRDGIAFRVDASNFDTTMTRNRLRHEILPVLEREVNASLVDVLTRTATQAQECQAAVNAVAHDWLVRAEKPRSQRILVFDRALLAAAPPFWIREMFRLVWKREHWPMGEMNADDWRRLERLVDGQLSRHDFPGGVHARSQRHVVQIWLAERSD
ncbi:MAG: tRNA lysidine(34) synthetase TilS [Planctomycetota bacterium]